MFWDTCSYLRNYLIGYEKTGIIFNEHNICQMKRTYQTCFANYLCLNAHCRNCFVVCLPFKDATLLYLETRHRQIFSLELRLLTTSEVTFITLSCRNILSHIALKNISPSTHQSSSQCCQRGKWRKLV